MTVEGLLLDIDGVLAVSWEPLPGAVDAIAAFRRDGHPFRLITNTTSFTCASLAGTLRDAGFDVRDEEVITATVATATHLRETYPGAPVFVLNDGDADADMTGIPLVATPEEAEVVVIGGAGDGFAYDVVNRMFRRVMDGAALVGMHRNRYWRTARGWELDGGAFLAGLETATGVEAVACGKPSATYFRAALQDLGVDARAALMVGDDIENDVEGARAAGIRAALVRTGKYRAGDESRGAPDAVLDSFADLPAWLRDERPGP
ncbi:MAG TPA: TIGR01458 family HAD-type hydrolase [Actinomycetota bacterium]